jgi:hypothetical protein
MTEHRFQIASLMAPCTPALFVFIGFLTQSFQWNFLIVGLALLTSYLGFFIVGYPLIYLLRRTGLLSLPVLMLSGLVFGVLVFYLFSLFLGFLLESSAPFGLSATLWGALLGLCVALSFGLIAGITWHAGGTPQKRAP